MIKDEIFEKDFIYPSNMSFANPIVGFQHRPSEPNCQGFNIILEDGQKSNLLPYDKKPQFWQTCLVNPPGAVVRKAVLYSRDDGWIFGIRFYD